LARGKARVFSLIFGLQNESRKVERLNDLRIEGLCPRIDVLVHGLEDEQTALTIEAAVIDALELGALTNEVRGARTGQFGRTPLSELLVSYAAAPVEIIDPVLLIRINRLYVANMSMHALYEATRGTWVLGRQRERARFAFAVYHGVVRGVFYIKSWHPGGSTDYETRQRENLRGYRRWEFTGGPASDEICSRYVGKSVSSYLPKGQQNPVRYVNCGSGRTAP